MGWGAKGLIWVWARSGKGRMEMILGEVLSYGKIVAYSRPSTARRREERRMWTQRKRDLAEKIRDTSQGETIHKSTYPEI